MDDAALYIRLRAVCCSEWGLAPPEFERLAEGGRIAAEDVIEAVLLRCASPLAGDVMGYLFRERARERRRRLEQVKGLVLALRGTKDPVKRARLAERIEALQGSAN